MNKLIKNEKLYAKLSPKLEEKDDCILWKGSRRVQIDNQYVKPQRAMVYALYGQTPAGSIKLLCDNRNCVNLNHLIFDRKFNPVGTVITGVSGIDVDIFYEDEDMFAELRRICHALGHKPSTKEWAEHSEIPVRAIKYRFKTWTRFMKKPKLNLKKAQVETLASLDQEEVGRVSSELHRVADLLGHPPSEEEFTNHGRFTLIKVKRVFKKRDWNEIIEQVFGSVTAKAPRKAAAKKDKAAAAKSSNSPR